MENQSYKLWVSGLYLKCEVTNTKTKKAVFCVCLHCRHCNLTRLKKEIFSFLFRCNIWKKKPLRFRNSGAIPAVDKTSKNRIDPARLRCLCLMEGPFGAKTSNSSLDCTLSYRSEHCVRFARIRSLNINPFRFDVSVSKDTFLFFCFWKCLWFFEMNVYAATCRV